VEDNHSFGLDSAGVTSGTGTVGAMDLISSMDFDLELLLIGIGLWGAVLTIAANANKQTNYQCM
jgi:hypothetical protein